MFSIVFTIPAAKSGYDNESLQGGFKMGFAVKLKIS